MPETGTGGGNVQIQGLEFAVKTVSEQSDGFKQIADGLKQLDDSVKNVPRISKIISSISDALKPLNKVNFDSFHKMADGLKALSEVGKIKVRIPETFTDQLTTLNILSQSIKSDAIQAVGTALHSFDGLEIPKIPESFTKRLTELNSVSLTAQPDNVQRLGEALHSFDGLQMPEGLAKSLSAIANVGAVTSQIDAGKLYSLIPALKAFQSLNFNFSPSHLGATLKEIVTSGNAITNDSISNLYRLSSALKMFETLNLSNSGNFRELGEALNSFSYFYIPDGFAQSMQYIKDGIQVFREISGEDIQKIADLTTLFNKMPTGEMTNFYNVLDSFSTATKEISEIGHFELAPLKEFFTLLQSMRNVGEGAISPQFLKSMEDLATVAHDMNVNELNRLFTVIQSFGGVGKNFNFVFPTGFSDFARDMKKAIELFPRDWGNFGAGFRAFLYQLQNIGEVPHIRSVADLFTAFSQLGTVTIDTTLADRLMDILDVIREYTEEDIQKLHDLADALKYLGEVQKTVKTSKLPKIEVPKVQTDDVKNSFKELYDKLPQWAQTAVNGLKTVFSGLFAIFGEIKDGVFAAVKHIFTLQNAMALLGTTAKGVQLAITAPVKAIRGLDSAIRNIPKNVQKMTKNFTKAVKTVQKFAKQITKLVKSFKKLADSIGKTLFSPLQNLIKRFTKFIHSIERIALYRAIRRGIQLITQGFQEGIENLYQYSLLINSDFHKSMDLLATDALYVKNSLGAMVSPLINAFAPAIDAITDKFVDLLNLVNQTFAALTGKETFTAAKKYATVWAEAAEETKKATTDAGDAVKDTLEEIKRYTLGFDELNVLGDPNKDNTANKNKNSLKDSDADEDVKDYLSMFQELPVSGAIADFVKKIREAIQNSEFYEAGKMIAEKLNEHFSSIEYETLGEKIGEKINNAITIAKGFLDFADFITLGEGVAKFLNKAFEQIDFLNLGAVLAGKIRLGLQFAFGFVKTFHFREFGEDLGKMISGFVISIDFDMAVKTLQMGFEGILDTIYGFLTQLQSFAFGVKIKNALSLAEFEGISERFQMIGEELKRNVSDFLKGLGAEIAIENPFDRLGAWLGTQLTIAFRKIPYAEIGATFGNGIQSIIANARNFWQNLDLSGLVSGIAKFLNNAIGNIDFWSVGAIIGEKLSTVVNGITSFLNTVNWDSVFDEITATITGFFENLDFNKVNFNHIGQSFGKFVNTALKNIAKFLKGLNTRGIADSISSFLKSVFSEIDIGNFTDVFSWLVVDILDFVAELLENIDGKKVGKAIGKFLTGLDWGGIFYELGRVLLGTLRGLWDVLSTAVGEIWEKVNEKLDSVHIENPFSDEGAIGKAVSGWLAGIGDKFSEALQGIENKFSGFFGKIFSTEDGKTPADRFGEIMQGIEDKASAGAEKVWEALSGIEEFFGWTDIKASAHGESIGNSFIGIGKDSSDTSSVLQENWGLWQESFNETMDKIVNFAGNAKDKLKEHWGMWQQSFNETIDNMLQYVEKLKTGFKVAGNFIKNTVKNALNGCIGFVEGFVNAWVTGFNDIADIINGFSIDIPDWVPSIGGSSWSPNLPKYNTVSLPRFENGGFPKSGELFLANENGVPEMVGRMGGQTAVANNEQIVQGIAQGVMMAMNSGSQNQLIRQAITLLQAIAEKDPVVEVTTNSIDKAKNRQNLRNGVLS